MDFSQGRSYPEPPKLIFITQYCLFGRAKVKTPFESVRFVYFTPSTMKVNLALAR